MAGLVPAIHAFTAAELGKTWVVGTTPGSSPGAAMTNKILAMNRSDVV
jgi:hypothetical protein